jgi:predicted RND superfamily exporter protein
MSALTSVMGFLVMAMAPTPIFATFGALTAVMIVLSLLVAILVLPSLLVLVTPDRHQTVAVAVPAEPVPEPVGA